MDENVINHFSHEHPLILTENVGYKEAICYGCRKPVVSESAYVCIDQYCSRRSDSIIHKRCAELPKKISHASHSLHHLNIHDFSVQKQFWHWTCNLCHVRIECGIGYLCQLCLFAFDISCPKAGCIYDSSEKKRLQHKGHYHSLTLMRRPAPFPFECDACGTDDSDMCYMCGTCELWIHKTCALLPDVIQINRHPHQLSLAFDLPIEYRNCTYRCDVCRKELLTTYWVYYCGDCRYFAHVKCATRIKATENIIPAESSNADNLIQFPLGDFSKELITPFVENHGLSQIDTEHLPTSVTMPQTTASFSLLFNYHKHPLSLVSEGPTATAVRRDESSIMICDVCVTPVYSPPYYHCPTCNDYFVHSTCYLLPETLSHPDMLRLHDGECPEPNAIHKMRLCTGSELDNQMGVLCSLCLLYTNGRVYRCEDCKLIMDVKCAALPATLKHESHLHVLTMNVQKEEELRPKVCDGCGFDIKPFNFAYYCTDSGCDFTLDMECVLLPKSIKHEWDRHPLMLTYQAFDHPSDFYCEDCEEEMNPREWMYHCQECDRSFDIPCLRRNIKYGRQVEFGHHIHAHPLTMAKVTIKLRCDFCQGKSHGHFGFQCELCNFVLCYLCGVRELNKM